GVGELLKRAVPSGAPAGGDGANYDLFQIAGLRFRLLDLIGGQVAAIVEFTEVRARGRITGISGDGVPDIGSEPVQLNSATIFQRFGVEELGLGKTLIGRNLIELWSLGVISIGHQTAQIVGAVRVVLICGQLEPFLGHVAVRHAADAEEVESSGEPTSQRVALLSRLAIQVDGLARVPCEKVSGFVIVSQCDLGWSVAEVAGPTKVVDSERVISGWPNASDGVHPTLIERVRRRALR